MDGAVIINSTYTVAVVFNTTETGLSKIKMYIGGVSVPTVSVASAGTVTGNIGSAQNLKIGARYANTAPFAGRQFDTVIVGEALPEATVQGVSLYLDQAAGIV
jgi:hypothetical protein